MNRASLVHRAVAAREDVRDDGVFSIFASSVDVRVVGFTLHFVTYFRSVYVRDSRFFFIYSFIIRRIDVFFRVCGTLR